MTRLAAALALASAGCTALFPFEYAAAPADALPRGDGAGLDASDVAADGPGDPPCPPGFDRCGGPSCIDLRSNASRCGSCDAVCALANATAACEDGACVAASCNPGYGDCDGDAANGCEASLATARAHCGRCGNACAATAACREGACRVSSCAGTLGNCDGDDANGCEADTATSPAHCGACGRACALPNATAACAAGACRVGACGAGFGDCDGVAANGCEADLSGVGHCGRCGNACPAAGGAASCAGGACALACAAGRADCDGAAANGCEADLTGDVAHCGACGARCADGQRCSAGRCVAACAPGEATCGSSCAVLATSTAHCGACGRACAVAGVGAATCAAGVCGVACPAGQGDCDRDPANGCEVTLAGNVSHCNACDGACGSPPHATATCGAAGCGFACAIGFADCNASRADGCETPTTSDVDNCGRCGGRCAPAHAAGQCVQGACQVRACEAGFADCDGNAANGCEVDTRADNVHCGGCGRACRLARATAACRGGSCQLVSCSEGYADCDGDAADGCEVNVTNTAAHCGRCRAACAASCVASTCCGAEGEPCCAGACTTGVCIADRCRAVCGLAGQPCCLGLCAPGMICGSRVSGPVCTLCGRVGQPCCALGACREGRCAAGTCQ